MKFADQGLLKIICVMFFMTSCRLERPYPTDNQEGSEVTGSKGSSCSFYKGKRENGDNGVHELGNKSGPSTALFSLDSTNFGTEIEFPLSPMGRCRFWKYQEHLLSRCRQCTGDISCEAPTTPSGPIKVTSRGQNLLIFVALDPGVLEIRTQPMAYPEFEGWAGVIDHLVFGAAKDMGDFIEDPDLERNRWSGHINVSWPGLVNERERTSMALLLNYVVDANNHPELAMGVLGGDTRNAPPLALGSPHDRAKLKDIIKQFNLNAYQSQSELAEDIFTAHAKGFRDRYSSLRYNLVNLDHLREYSLNWEGYSGKRVEARGFFTPINSSEIMAYYRIVNHRLKYLFETYATKGKVVEFAEDRFYESSFRPLGMQPPLTPHDGAKTFLSYLREMGLNPWVEGQFLRDSKVREALEKIRAGTTKETGLLR